MSETGPLGPAQWAEITGIRTHYAAAGKGASVLFIHGGEIGTATGSMVHWLDCFAALSRDFSVLAYDRPGMGRTGLPLRDSDFTLAAAGDHARRLVEAKTSGAVHLVAHGTGARIALDLCLAGEIKVASCCLLNSATVTPGALELVPRPTTSETWEPERQALEHYRGLFAPHSGVPPVLVSEAAAIRRLDTIRSACHKMEQEGLRRKIYLRDLGAGRGAIFRRLKETGVPCPVLVVNGIDDPLVDASTTVLLVSALTEKQDDVELRLLADCGHYPQIEKGAIVSGIIAGFISQHAA